MTNPQGGRQGCPTGHTRVSRKHHARVQPLSLARSPPEPQTSESEGTNEAPGDDDGQGNEPPGEEEGDEEPASPEVDTEPAEDCT